MKILHIGNLKSGIDTYVRNTIANISNDFEFVIVNGADDESMPYIRNGAIVRSYSICMYRQLNPLKDFKALIQAVKIIKKEKPDIIHCHSAKGGVIGRVAGFLTRCKTAYTAHAFSFLSAESPRKRSLYLILEKVTRLKSWLIACSKSEQRLGTTEVGYKKCKALEWANSINNVDDAENIADLPSDRYVCSIGRPSYQKNPLLMVEVARIVHQSYDDVKFMMLGTGFYSPLLANMKNKIVEYGLEDVFILKPWLNHKEAMGYLKSSSVFLTNSIYEGLPIAVLEAMSLGKAIVATDVIGNNDCLLDGESGLLTDMNAEEIANKIILILSDSNLRMRIGMGARQAFETNFLITNRIKKLEEIYKAITAN